MQQKGLCQNRSHVASGDCQPVIEVEVHQQLRAFLREQGQPHWPHHLTIARLVARALRLKRSALIQVGFPSGYCGRYRLSYLASILIWPEPVILVVPEAVQQRLLKVEIPRLCQWMQVKKPIQVSDRWPDANFGGLLITSPAVWLAAQLSNQEQFPLGVPVVLDDADYLENWTREQLTTSLVSKDWEDLMLSYPSQIEMIRDTRVRLTQAVFQHPTNPYECCLLEQSEQASLARLYLALQPLDLTLCPPWQKFWQQFHQEGKLAWAEIHRRQGQFSLHCAPVEVASRLERIWSQQPVVLLGSALDPEPEASLYRQQLGLGELTCLKFSPDRQGELIQLYLPEGVPMPNTPQFQTALVQQIHQLLIASQGVCGLAVLIIEDLPLKAQIGSVLAAELGSRVQVEKTCLDDNGVLVTGWAFWQQHQEVLPTPQLLVIATLPIPSLEDPRVAGRVAYYKQQRQDWFRLYLLPEALMELQRAVAPLRERQGVVALLDSRVIHRSYGQQVLTALSPYARVNYLDQTLFSQVDYPLLDRS